MVTSLTQKNICLQMYMHVFLLVNALHIDPKPKSTLKTE